MKEIYQETTGKICRRARELLESGTVSAVIGYEDSDLPMRATPAIVREAADADRLVWHGGCRENLADFVRRVEGRKAVVARGCAGRALVGLMQEKQVARQDVHIIGVPCYGALDFHVIERALDFEELVDGEETADGKVVVRSEVGEATLDRDAALYAGCRTCEFPTPPIHDELIGDAIAPRAEGCADAKVEAVEALSAAERWTDFEANLSACIRCYACRNACPLCYCATCFTERATPQWLGTTPEPADAQLYHMVRALHLGGRCVDCGACNHACPQGIDLRRLNKKLEKAAREMFDFTTGIDPDAKAVMATYDMNDPQDFILE